MQRAAAAAIEPADEVRAGLARGEAQDDAAPARAAGPELLRQAAGDPGLRWSSVDRWGRRRFVDRVVDLPPVGDGIADVAGLVGRDDAERVGAIRQAGEGDSRGAGGGGRRFRPCQAALVGRGLIGGEGEGDARAAAGIGRSRGQAHLRPDRVDRPGVGRRAGVGPAGVLCPDLEGVRGTGRGAVAGQAGIALREECRTANAAAIEPAFEPGAGRGNGGEAEFGRCALRRPLAAWSRSRCPEAAAAVRRSSCRLPSCRWRDRRRCRPGRWRDAERVLAVGQTRVCDARRTGGGAGRFRPGQAADVGRRLIGAEAEGDARAAAGIRAGGR